ncbi:MAG: hypothetical protein GX604_02865 [Actinobacteria bacterium]|nr:hypothetical protein [Actinomycetota bacterium]
MSWVLLVFAGLLEVVWAIALKLSNGFTSLVPTIVGIFFLGDPASVVRIVSIALIISGVVGLNLAGGATH